MAIIIDFCLWFLTMDTQKQSGTLRREEYRQQLFLKKTTTNDLKFYHKNNLTLTACIISAAKLLHLQMQRLHFLTVQPKFLHLVIARI